MMPIYEFYCPDCHRIYSFLSTRVDPADRPDCPRCERPELERQASVFSVSRKREESDDTMADIDDAKLEKAMAMLSREAEGLDEEDPRQAAQLMRKLSDAAGIDLGSGMEEAIRRMEAGEDPEEVEADMGDILDSEDLFAARKKSARKKDLPPSRDETIYDL